MEHERVVKLRSNILDKLYKCDNIFQNTIKFDSIVVIECDKIDSLLIKKSIESVELCKSLTMFENTSDAITYLNLIKTPPSLILLSSNCLNHLNSYNINNSQTRVIILSEKNSNSKKYLFESIEKPLNINKLKKYFNF